MRLLSPLRGATRVGARLRTDGRPDVASAGTLIVGDDVKIVSRPVRSHLIVEPGARLEIGDGVVIGQGAAIAVHELVRIGDGARLGDFVSIADTDFHVPGDRDAHPPTTPVVIGARVRIGPRVTILRGAHLGDGAEVAAGSVVSGAVQAGARVAGAPARQVGRDGARAELVSISGVVRRALGLTSDPGPDAGPDQVPEWDSLGALKILLALEEELSITLNEEVVARATRVADLAAAVDGALAVQSER